MKSRILVKTTLRRVLGMKGYEIFMLWRGLGYIPHVRNPRIFNEKIAHRKLYRWRQIPVDLVDKFYVFHGRVEFVQVDTGRGSEDHTCRVYDRTWSRMVYPFRQSPADPSQKPRLLAEMIRLAEILAAGWDFVRIDLYSPSHERILFGEITFTPSAGWQKFTDKAFDTEIGSAWHLT